MPGDCSAFATKSSVCNQSGTEDKGASSVMGRPLGLGQGAPHKTPGLSPSGPGHHHRDDQYGYDGLRGGALRCFRNALPEGTDAKMNLSTNPLSSLDDTYLQICVAGSALALPPCPPPFNVDVNVFFLPSPANNIEHGGMGASKLRASEVKIRQGLKGRMSKAPL